jgi:hypothetical protein
LPKIMSNTKDIQPKQAETKLEQLIIGFIADESDRIQYGKLTLEITVHKGKPTNLQAIEVKRSFNLNA